MKLCAISDIHGQFENLKIKDSDVLFICGDVVPLNIQSNDKKSFEWLQNTFVPWCKKQPVAYIVMVAGNHDFVFERRAAQCIDYLDDNDIDVLYNDSIIINDFTIWGSPYCHKFGNWAFMPDDKVQLESFSQIPDNLDILVTHDAAYGRNDILLDKSVWWADGSHIGNPMLAKVLEEKSPKYHFTGHLHSTDHNLTEYNGTKTACVSLLDEHYQMVYKPLYLDIWK